MTERLLDEAQYQRLLEAISKIGEHTPYIERFLTAAAPVLFAALLGLAFGFITEWVKTRKEKRKSDREKEEKELSQLNVITTAMWFNLEEILHIVIQQILPHREQSHAAAAALNATSHDEAQYRHLLESMNERFPAMTMRCPRPHLLILDFFKDIPFALEKDPELLKTSAWVASYAESFLEVITARNTQIDNIGKSSFSGGVSAEGIAEHVRIQAHLGDIAAINALMFIRQVQIVCDKIEILLKGYKHLPGKKLKGFPPPALEKAVKELELIAKDVNSDLSHAEEHVPAATQ